MIRFIVFPPMDEMLDVSSNPRPNQLSRYKALTTVKMNKYGLF